MLNIAIGPYFLFLALSWSLSSAFLSLSLTVSQSVSLSVFFFLSLSLSLSSVSHYSIYKMHIDSFAVRRLCWRGVLLMSVPVESVATVTRSVCE